MGLRSTIARLTAAALLLGGAAAVGLAPVPAQAAYCTTADGVSVQVDFGALGGGSATGCGRGDTAADVFGSAGFTLTPDDQQRSFVCQVEGKPAAGEPCIETNAYWAFFVSNDGGGWVYASLGVYSQPVDPGDSVALVWQSTNSRRTPGAGPGQPVAASSAATPKPSAQTSTRPTRRPSPQPTAKASTAKPAAEPTAEPTATPTTTTPSATTASATGTPSTTASTTVTPTAAGEATPTTASPTAATATETEPPRAEEGDVTPVAATDSVGGLPGWVPPAVIVVLLAAAGGIALVRRRAS